MFHFSCSFQIYHFSEQVHFCVTFLIKKIRFLKLSKISKIIIFELIKVKKMSSINKHVIPVINVALKRAVGIRLKTRFSLDARVHIGYLTPEIEKNDVSSAKTFSPVEFEYKVWNYTIDNPHVFCKF